MVAIREVARHAGVSVASVSRVLNGSPLVKESLRHRILQAMAELDYSPSVPARSLRYGRTKLLGVLVPDSPNPFWSAVIRGIEGAAYAAGYCVIVCSSDADPGRELQYLRVLREHRVAGIILGLGDAQLRAKVPSLQRQVAILRQAGIPTVSVDKRVAGMDSVMLDNVRAAAQAVEHLIRLGHERIGIITGPLWTTTGRGRLIGYRRAMRRAGLPLERSLQGIGPFSQQSGATLAQAMLSHRDWPTALIAASNDLTLGVLSAVAPIGLHIPGDLALVGFDEMNWASTLMSPLTTVVQPAKEMGAAACRLLLDRITGDVTGPAQRLHFPGRLIVRQSSGAPADEQDPGPNFLHLISGPQNVCSTYVGPAAMLTIEMKGG